MAEMTDLMQRESLPSHNRELAIMDDMADDCPYCEYIGDTCPYCERKQR